MLDLNNTRPTWVEINLDNLAHNMKEVKNIVKKDTLITAVVKANGYGHDAAEASKTFLKNGADRLAVATLSEAIELRNSGINDTPILILGYTPNSQAEYLLKYNIISTIYSFNQAQLLSRSALEQNKISKIHIKIDTGMRRLGFESNAKSIEEILKISKLPNIEIEGIFTHFACADEENKRFTRLQFTRFKYITDELEKRGLRIPIKHVSNSAAIIDLPEYNLDMVRAGVMLYGLYPSMNVDRKRVDLKSAMSLKTKISYVKCVEKSEGISYGHIYVTNKTAKIGTLPIGYADGFTRILSNDIEVTLKGKKVNVLGRICMDQTMINLSEVMNAEIGDIVTIFSGEEKNTNSIDDIAHKLNTINYEVVCMIAKRVPRVFVKGDNFIKVKDYNLHNMSI
ncbi:alanine racemase [Senegalia massiliensis]|uniref:Alanine racemase n=1 Tax=Senegalia massiliensis TaxID=1720316 RepID=A0A845R2M5_9CLOT|nr:alanine racemase [Senegalia massiliensis]NBI07818.1 alanine racemase [Senegalia massiliensis]